MVTIPPYIEFKNKWPLSPTCQSFIDTSRNTIRKILNGEDSRLLIIVGPCSIHDKESTLEFAHNLVQFSHEVSDKFFIVMRTYVEKARSSVGWKGFLYDPLLNGSHEITTGITWTRQLLLNLIQMKMPTATEFLDPITAAYYDDLICWGSIGARSSSSQPHRQLASNLSMPVGIKNGIAGNISAAIQGCLTSGQPHIFVGLNHLGQPCIINSVGNIDSHVVLRGGENSSNYDSESIAHVIQQLEKHQLPKRLLIDCSHGNSRKKPQAQSLVFQNIIDQVKAGNRHIRGALLESHLVEGNQVFFSDPISLKYGLSITDACLDWNSTRQLILQEAKKLKIPHAN